MTNLTSRLTNTAKLRYLLNGKTLIEYSRRLKLKYMDGNIVVEHGPSVVCTFELEHCRVLMEEPKDDDISDSQLSGTTNATEV